MKIKVHIDSLKVACKEAYPKSANHATARSIKLLFNMIARCPHNTMIEIDETDFGLIGDYLPILQEDMRNES